MSYPLWYAFDTIYPLEKECEVKTLLETEVLDRGGGGGGCTNIFTLLHESSAPPTEVLSQVGLS